MPRKKIKIEERVVNFLLNPDDKTVIDEMVESTVRTNTKDKVKVNIANQIDRLRYCYYFICDYIQENSYSENIDENGYVNINQQTMKEILGVNNVAAILDNLIGSNIVQCDDDCKVGEYSYGYRLVKKSYRLFSFQIPEFSSKANKADIKGRQRIIASGLEEYDKAVQLITIDESKLPAIKDEIIKNKYKENEEKKLLLKTLRIPNLRSLINQYKIKLYNNPYNHNSTKIIVINNSFINAQTVPVKNKLSSPYAQTVPIFSLKIACSIYAMKTTTFCRNSAKLPYAQTVPGKEKDEKLLSNEIIYMHYGVSVRNMKTANIPWLSEFRRKRFQDKLDAMHVEDDETTLHRVDKIVIDINNRNFKTSRPEMEFKYQDENGIERKERIRSRVYSNHTNMYRELREIMLLDGKSTIVVDLSNSQPLIAVLLFRDKYKRLGIAEPDDILKYLTTCEESRFYEHFMKYCGVDTESEDADGLRSQFKSEFFKSIYFSKSIEKSNHIKDLFIQRYPGCYDAMFNIKGKKNYSMSYKNFSKILQVYESQIFFDQINIPLLKAGIIAVNNYDSISVNNMEDYETAKNMIIGNFAARNIKAHLKPKFYGTHKQNIKKEEKEMKKKYTVDELLSSKEEVAITLQEPTKLQHLKNYEHKKKDDFERIVKGIQEQDAEDEAKKNKIPRTEEEINESAIQTLKDGKIELSKINIDYMVNEIKSAVKELDNPAETKKPYKFVNPYTN